MNTEFELFPGKNLSGLFADIYKNQQSKKIKISSLINDIKLLVKTSQDYSMLGSLLKDLVDSSIKNDDSLVKLATIAQRIISTTISADDGSGGMLTDDEKEQLLRDIDETVAGTNDVTDEKVGEMSSELDDITKKMKTNEQ